ncbi:PspA-associated protein PspAB [Candidatus Methanoliparum sp. LAM-1]|uniref:PspA-associated protein PspAB n=1 Tax=Candidatus Methanoliparum sp. LAM-1 TaxID=2874846 RepID=UPI001E4F5270|nr:hypothetical protein [Candidatus Methanoliparum sp. LAM-1]BDC36265.1 hypothetical protein MTLP_09470 [Candidatus Methanoliparum sp. LAM-1]
MKFFDILLGRTRIKKPNIDGLFSLSTAYLTLKDNSFDPKGIAGICFKPMESKTFVDAKNDILSLLDLSTSDLKYSIIKDDYGYEWFVLKNDDFEDLIVNIHIISEVLIDKGFEERLLSSVFAFNRFYLIYNYKSGKFYPFAPLNNERDNKLEFKIKSMLKEEIPIEEDITRWYPIKNMPL